MREVCLPPVGGTEKNITWLIEIGYHIYTKAHNAQVANKLKSQVETSTRFSRVGKNAEMTAFGQQFLHKCPYPFGWREEPDAPLTMALQRFHTPDGLKHSTLIVYRDDGCKKTLSQWFHFYNSRQQIEAGINVKSGVKVRSNPV